MLLNGFSGLRYVNVQTIETTLRKPLSWQLYWRERFFAIWVELTGNEQKDYTVTKKNIIDAIMPIPFVSLADLHKRMLLPGESLSLYVHQLKQLLSQAMPDISNAAREQFLLHQFLSQLPQDVSKQLRAMGAMTTLTVTMQ